MVITHGPTVLRRSARDPEKISKEFTRRRRSVFDRPPEAPHFSDRVALVPALLVMLPTAMHEVAEGQETAWSSRYISPPGLAEVCRTVIFKPEEVPVLAWL